VDYLLITLFWLIYFFLHSFLASRKIKNRLIPSVFTKERHFRLFYSVISLLGLLFFFYVVLILVEVIYVFTPSVFSYSVGLLTLFIGLIVAKRAFKPFDLSSFIGVSEEKDSLTTGGLYEKIRHPLYLATIVLILGAFVIFPTYGMLTSTVCIFIYLPIGIYFEEKKLIRQYGESYEKYRNHTPPIFSLKLFF